MQHPDFLIVGSGLTGATIARLLTDQGRRCLVLERRAHTGGNVHDVEHPSGIRLHTYGPHYFRTSSKRIWDFVRRFGPFYPFEAQVKSWVAGRYENWPPGPDYLERTLGANWTPGFQGKPSDFEEMALSKMPRQVYDDFVRGYTLKQWGVDPKQLAAGLAKRFDLQSSEDPRLSPKARFQGLPTNGYTQLLENMLAGIPVLTGVDYLLHRREFSAREKIIFTGPIDEFFGFDLGRLLYRGQRRQHEYLPELDWFQPVVQVNNPDPGQGDHLRTLEWKHLLPPEKKLLVSGTLITRETPYSPDDPGQYEYPFPDAANKALYKKYQSRTTALPNLLICGRLGEYRYLDMDQAIARAMKWARALGARG